MYVLVPFCSRSAKDGGFLDHGKDIRRISFCNYSGRWPGCLAKLFGFLLHCCTEDGLAGCSKLLSECILRTLPYGQGRLANHSRLLIVL